MIHCLKSAKSAEHRVEDDARIRRAWKKIFNVSSAMVMKRCMHCLCSLIGMCRRVFVLGQLRLR